MSIYIRTVGAMRKIASNDAITLKVSSSIIVSDKGGLGKRKGAGLEKIKIKWPEADGWVAHFCVFGDEIEKRELLDYVWDCTEREIGR